MSADVRFPVGRAAVRLGAFAIAWLGTLEALAGVTLEVKLKGMYLGPGAEWSAVLTRLVDVTVIWKSAALHALAGGLAAGILGALVDLVDRARGGRAPAPGARAVGVLAAALAVLVVEYGLIRRGWAGALWPLDGIGALDVAALVPLAAGAWAVAQVARRAALAVAGSRLGARALPLAERAGWATLAVLAVASFVVTAMGKPAATGGGDARGARTATRPPDVVLLVLDTARADRFSTFGAARPTSPALTALAARGTLYAQAMSTAPWTLPSHGTLFTGELPHRHGADWGWMQLRPEMRTLAESFRDAGYRTAAFTNNPWIGPVAGLDRGFDELHPMWRRHGGTWDRLLLVRAARRATGDDPDEGAAETIAAVDRWLASANDVGGGGGDAATRPAFLFVNLMELHDPNWPERGAARWLPPGTTRARLRGLNQNPYRWFARRVTMNDADFALLADLYDAQVSYLDERVAELVRVLDERRGLGNVVLAIVGDHGENLGDHGLLSHVFSLHQSLVHVPLLVVAPGRVAAGETVTEPVSLVDVAPTLEGLAAVAAAGAPGRRGRSLIAEPPAARAERILIAEHPPPGPILDILRSNDASLDLSPFDRSWLAAREGNWKLIVSGDGAPRLFDLGADPGETRDVASDHPEVVARLGDALAEARGRIPVSRGGAAAGAPAGQALDPETVARLHALGYM